MGLEALFPSYIYRARLGGAGARALNRKLLLEARALRADDAAGRRWSARNYPGGFTSYGSASRMHRQSPTFAALERRLDAHVRRYASALDFDLKDKTLAMTDCWVNIMPQHAAHGFHLHPHSTVSGTYYVRTPPKSPGLKLEDPRLDRFMAAPPRRSAARRANRSWVTLPAEAGALILFESWLRHEVAPNPGDSERVSVSFNYHWT